VKKRVEAKLGRGGHGEKRVDIAEGGV